MTYNIDESVISRSVDHYGGEIDVKTDLQYSRLLNRKLD